MADILHDLRTTGLARLVVPYYPASIAALNAYLLAQPVYRDAHVPQTARNLGTAPIPRDRAADSECVCVELRAAILAPALIEVSLDLTDIVEAYLGRDPPLAYSMNAFWTRPGPSAPRKDIQGFHRDADDTAFLAMFIYLTDVLDEADGPHELIGPDGVTRRITGPVGTAFLADTRYQHRGIKPTRGERGICWMRWGVSDPPASYIWDKNEPIAAAALGDRYPADPRLRESIKLLVTPP